jgi:hypothetical protein
MSKYCPVGKIECEYFTYDNIVCPAKDMMVQDGVKFEVCPWPSRQRPVEKPIYICDGCHLPETDCLCDDNFGPVVPKAGDDEGSAYLKEIGEAHALGYTAGINEGVERSGRHERYLLRRI